jgi:hypothetical protein
VGRIGARSHLFVGRDGSPVIAARKEVCCVGPAVFWMALFGEPPEFRHPSLSEQDGGKVGPSYERVSGVFVVNTDQFSEGGGYRV